MRPHAIAGVALGVIYINKVYHASYRHQTSHHSQHALAGKQGYRHGGECHLYNLYAQYARRAPAHLDEVVVDGGEHGEAAAHAQQLEEGYGVPPLALEEHTEECRRHHHAADEQREGEE